MVKRGQVTLELVFAFVLTIILFYASVTIFVYLNNRMVRRQQAYESSPFYGRVAAADPDAKKKTDVQVDEAELFSLNFFDY